MAQAGYLPGSLVHARGRDWVVLPPDEDDVLRLRPLTGAGGHGVGLYLPLERTGLKPATFGPPSAEACGDASGVWVLFDAARLSLRSGAALVRSLGRLNVVPRPCQFVPLIMAHKSDAVAIADDDRVGPTS